MKNVIKRIVKYIIKLVYPDFLYYWYSVKSFSQYGEDMILNAFYKDHEDYKGFYVDVGAFHPFRYSNTALFYKKGWKGINIEPSPNSIKEFKIHRKRDVNLNVGISDSNQKLIFFEFDEPALNNFDRDLSLSISKNTNFNIISENEIQVYTLSNILAKHLPKNQRIDFLDVDVEGFDLKVLKSNDWSLFRPVHILIEAVVDFEKLNENEIFIFLLKNDYELIGRSQRTFIFKDKNNSANNAYL